MKRIQSRMRLGLVAVFPFLVPVGPAASQVALFDSAQVTAACLAAPDLCEAHINAAVSALQAAGLSGEVFHTQLGILASLVLAVVLDPAVANPNAIAPLLEHVASASGDAAQAQAIRTVVAHVADGNLSLIQPGPAFAASPT